ncbi:cytochrome P450 [Planomonospora corallina]|uniref:Cytochrome P450 n=1 Tax=Planomonospora corallina TaxID=1806052 RepID=A0ABV8IDT0_9ACTN
MGRIAYASVADTLRLGAVVLAPTVLQGVILRRPGVTALADALELDRRAVLLLRRMRAKYGDGPLVLRTPLRKVVLVLSPEDVRRVLAGTPEPFAAGNREKRSALGHFQPDGVLVSHGRPREDRRRFNEAVLDTHRSLHRLTDVFTAVLRQETSGLPREGTLTWDVFAPVWWRAVRRIVLGDTARDDDELVRLLNRLRADANWSYLRPRRRETYERFSARLRAHLGRAEPGSLAGLLPQTPVTERTRPESQVAHWLFAFDAAGIAAFRALALLTAHPGHAARARAEIAGTSPDGPRELPFLRACVLESVRLWPTTLAILRDGTRATHWDGEAIPRQNPFLIHSSFVNRDEEADPAANRFTPHIWLDGTADERWSLVPFSRGPAQCPAQNLVLTVTSETLAALLPGRDLRVAYPRDLEPGRDLPYSLDHFTLRFDVHRTGADEEAGAGRAGAVHAGP